MTATIDDKIKAVFENTELISHTTDIEIGSDAFLDKVLHYKGRFDFITNNLFSLNEELITNFNENDEEAFRLLPNLRALYVSFIEAIDMYKKGRFGIALKTTLDNARIEAKQLREIIDDVNNIKITIKEDNDLQSLFKQL